MQSSNQGNVYVVLGWGRTGSNWICSILMKSFQNEIDPKTKQNKNTIIHTHNKNIVEDLDLDPKKVVLIISKRKDFFANVMSHLTAEITREWNGYTNKKATPEYVDPKAFKRWIDNKDSWYESIDIQQPFKFVTTVYYEDLFFNGQKHVMEKIGIENYKIIQNPIMQEVTFGVVRPSPYNYKDWVANWEELHNIYMLS